MANITIDIEILGNKVEVEVNYEWFGKNIAQTYYQPAEYPELEIHSIKRIVKGDEIDISDIFTDSEHDKILEILQSWLDEGE